MFIVSYKILGILIGFISVNLYLKFSEIKPIKKEDFKFFYHYNNKYEFL